VKLKKSVFTFLKATKLYLLMLFFSLKKTGKTTISQKKLNLGNISTKNFS
jgi:hypothetical protein